MASSTLHVLPDAANNSATTSRADANELIVSDYAAKILRAANGVKRKSCSKAVSVMSHRSAPAKPFSTPEQMLELQ